MPIPESETHYNDIVVLVSGSEKKLPSPSAVSYSRFSADTKGCSFKPILDFLQFLFELPSFGDSAPLKPLGLAGQNGL
jgi:hypothetical protein